MPIWKVIQQTNVPGNLEGAENTPTLFSLEEKKLFGFFAMNRKSIVNLFWFDIL